MEKNAMVDKVIRCIEKRYDAHEPVVIKAPGRINLMGTHTDYNLGFVLPASINYQICTAMTPNDTDHCRIYSIDFDQEVTVSLSEIKPGDTTWLNLILGVVNQLKERIGGFDLVFTGNIPRGSGLSSSAALCSSLAFGLSELFGLQLEKWDMAKLGQKSEHEFAGVQCGIMDQFASLFGETGKVLKLNCLSLTYESISFDIKGHQLFLFNSNVPHALHESAYNDRSNESAEALSFLKSKEAGITSFQDLDAATLEKYVRKLSNVGYRRARHIITENARVNQMSEALATGRFAEAGQLLLESHLSQQNDYEVTCEQTDFLVQSIMQEEAVLGARQVGGGFGGCVLGIAKDEDLDPVFGRLNIQYQARYGLSITPIPIKISEGCHLVEWPL